jgi:regulator of sigma D
LSKGSLRETFDFKCKKVINNYWKVNAEDLEEIKTHYKIIYPEDELGYAESLSKLADIKYLEQSLKRIYNKKNKNLKGVLNRALNSTALCPSQIMDYSQKAIAYFDLVQNDKNSKEKYLVNAIEKLEKLRKDWNSRHPINGLEGLYIASVLKQLALCYKELALRYKEQENLWTEPLRVDNELSDINPWRGADEENKATLRPRFQDIGNS